MREGYFCGFGDAFAEDLDFEVTEGGVELGGNYQRLNRLLVGARGWGWAYCYGHCAGGAQASFGLIRVVRNVMARWLNVPIVASYLSPMMKCGGGGDRAPIESLVWALARRRKLPGNVCRPSAPCVT